MKLDRDTRKQLKLEYEDHLEKATEKFVANDYNEASKHLSWISQYNELIEKNEQKTSLVWSIIIGCFLLVLFGLAISIRMPSCNISFEVLAGNTTFTLISDWSSGQEFVTERFYINNLEKVNAPGLTPPIYVENAEAFDMTVEGENMRFNGLYLPKFSECTIEQIGNTLAFYIKNTTLSGGINILNADYYIETIDETIENNVAVDIPETISFQTKETSAEPIKMEFKTNQGWELRELIVDKIGFYEENPPGSGKFQSTIISGTLNVWQTGDVFDIRKADNLSLSEIKGRRLEITRQGDQLKILFEGSVSEISLGPKGFETNLAPTLLQFGFYQRRLTFFTSAVVFFWGLLWSLKKSIFR